MQKNLNTIIKRFEKSYKTYDDNAVIQMKMANEMITQVSKISKYYQKILELGCGTGIVANLVKGNLAFDQYNGNDIVDSSKQYLFKYIPTSEFECCDALDLRYSKEMDLIISNAMFQWFDDFSVALNKIKTYLKDSGILAFSTFGPNNFIEISEKYDLKLNYISYDKILKILKDNDFKILYKNEYTETLLFSSPMEILQHMKYTGVNSISNTFWTIKDIKKFCNSYSKFDGAPRLTYSPIIIVTKLQKG